MSPCASTAQRGLHWYMLAKNDSKTLMNWPCLKSTEYYRRSIPLLHWPRALHVMQIMLFYFFIQLQCSIRFSCTNLQDPWSDWLMEHPIAMHESYEQLCRFKLPQMDSPTICLVVQYRSPAARGVNISQDCHRVLCVHLAIIGDLHKRVSYALESICSA